MKSIISLAFCILSAQATYAANVSLAETTPPDPGQEVQQLNTKIQGQLKTMQEQQKKDMSTLNTQVQQQLKQMQTELQNQNQTLKKQMQDQLKQVQTTLQAQIAQVKK